jgi:hypothetical protein
MSIVLASTVSDGSLAVTSESDESPELEASELSPEDASELSAEEAPEESDDDSDTDDELSAAELEEASFELELSQPVKMHTLSARAASIAENFFIISFFLSVTFSLKTALTAYSANRKRHK